MRIAAGFVQFWEQFGNHSQGIQGIRGTLFLPLPESHIDFSAMQKEADMEIVRKANLAIACVAFVFVAAIVIGWIG